MNKATIIFGCMLFTLFVGCQNTSEMKAQTFSSPYDTLVDKNPADLTYEQLYNRTLTLFNIEYQEIDLPTDYGKAHIIVAGPENAPALVLLHGLNASSTSWYPNFKALAKNYRVYAIDFFMEKNKSERQGDADELEQIIAWYQSIFAQLKLENFSLLGASRGGWLAVNLALNDTNNIQKLVLLSPAQTFGWIKPGMNVMTNMMYQMDPDRADLREVLQTLSSNVDGISQLYIDQFFRATTIEGFDFSITSMTPFSDAQLNQLNMPVLVLIGDDDLMNDDKNLERAQSEIKHVKTAIVKNAGHFLSVDQRDTVNKMVLEFLK